MGPPGTPGASPDLRFLSHSGLRRHLSKRSTVSPMRTPTWWRVDPTDVVLALALTLALQAEIWAPSLFGAEPLLTERPLLTAPSLAITLPLVLRRLYPWAVAVIAFSAEVAQFHLAVAPDGLANLLAMLVVAYSLGRHAGRPAGYAGIALVAVASFGVGQDLADDLFVLIVLGAAWAAGVLLGRRTEDLGAPSSCGGWRRPVTAPRRNASGSRVSCTTSWPTGSR